MPQRITHAVKKAGNTFPAIAFRPQGLDNLDGRFDFHLLSLNLVFPVNHASTGKAVVIEGWPRVRRKSFGFKFPSNFLP